MSISSSWTKESKRMEQRRNKQREQQKEKQIELFKKSLNKKETNV